MSSHGLLDLATPQSLHQDLTLSTRQFPALGAMASGSGAVPIVFLHGWGCDSRVWDSLLPLLQQQRTVITIDLPGFGSNAGVPPQDLSVLIDQLAQVCPPQFVLLGWSLGGTVATALAAHLPERVAALITVGSNLKFVAADDWPAAMPSADFSAFYRAFQRDPAAGLKRFVSLEVQGDEAPREALKALRAYASQSHAAGDTVHWLKALAWLADWDLREQFVRLPMPGLHLYADGDVLVPVEVVQHLPQTRSQQAVVLTNASHSFFCGNPLRLFEAIKPFLNAQETVADSAGDLQRNKQKVAASFSRAAQDYDAVAYFQRDVGNHLLGRYPLVDRPLAVNHSTFTVLDLGCGTGYFTAQLADTVTAQCQAIDLAVPDIEVLGCDIAEGMVRHARVAHTDVKHWLTGDAENLPLADASVDRIFSSMALQWCENPSALLAELQRVLKPGGSVVFSTLGPATLAELRQAWQTVDGFVHVNQFVSAACWKLLIAQSAMQLAGWQDMLYTLSYDTVFGLMRELKTLGAHNVNDGRSKGLTSRRRLSALQRAYDDFRCEGALPATYEVYFVHLRKPRS